MKIKDILNERGFIPLKPQSTEGLTFGFEIEFIVSRDWYGLSGEVVANVNDLDWPNDYQDYFDYDAVEVRNALEDFREETGNQKATMSDYIDKIGKVKFLEKINASVNEGYMLVDDDIVDARKSQVEVFYEIGQEYGFSPLNDDEDDGEDRYHVFQNAKQEEKDYSKWYIEPDESIKTNDDWDYNCEITSPIFNNYDKFISELEDLLNWIQHDFSGNQVGYTNGSCGLHINIGIPPAADPDFAKMAVFMGEKYLQKVFSRDTLQYINSHDKVFADAFADYKANNKNSTSQQLELFGDKRFERLIHYINEAFMKLNDNKYFVFNIIPYLEGKNYIEFRVLGGNDYEKKIDEIKKNINRFIFLIKLACNKQMYRKEYMQKVYAWLNSNVKAEPANIFVRQFKQWLISNNYENYYMDRLISPENTFHTTVAAKHAFVEILLHVFHNNEKFTASLFKYVAKEIGVTPDMVDILMNKRYVADEYEISIEKVRKFISEVVK